jgi:hypothetical protein
VWIFRGQGIPPIMLDECYDLELYNWTRVDIADPVRFAAPSALRLRAALAAVRPASLFGEARSGNGQEGRVPILSARLLACLSRPAVL